MKLSEVLTLALEKTYQTDMESFYMCTAVGELEFFGYITKEDSQRTRVAIRMKIRGFSTLGIYLARKGVIPVAHGFLKEKKFFYVLWIIQLRKQGL